MLLRRKLNLKLHFKGINDFGAATKYTPLDLVATARGCELDEAFGWLADALGWGGDPINLKVKSEQTKGPRPA